MSASTLPTFVHWIGLRVEKDALEVALTGANGELYEQVRVSNDRTALLRLLRHWNRRYRMDTAHTRFCLEDRRPWSGAALHLIVGRMWTLLMVDPAGLRRDRSSEDGEPDAHALVLYAVNHPERAEQFHAPRLYEEKIRHLRERRQHLMSIRGDFSSRSLDYYHHLEGELQREFERMDRRHMQLIDRLLERLDTLIRLQMQERS